MNDYNKTVTTDLSKFGYRELKMLKELLKARFEQGFPFDFYEEGISINLNINSGNVFFTNEDYQVATMNNDKLESFYVCPECGHEGFFKEMIHNLDNENCQEYFNEIVCNNKFKINWE